MLTNGLRALAHTAAGIWLGGMVMLAIVAPTTFGVIRAIGVENPNAVAGQVMAKNFRRFDLVQMSCAAVLLPWVSVSLLARRRTLRDILRAGLIVIAVCLMLYSVWYMTPRITDLQPVLAQPDPDVAMKQRFDSFHATAVRISQALLVILLVLNIEMALPARPSTATPEAG